MSSRCTILPPRLPRQFLLMFHGNSPHWYRAGFTILEMITALVILGSAVAFSLPAMKRQVDRTAVLGAREELAGLLHRARAEAVSLGGAKLHLVADPPAVELRAGGALLSRREFLDDYGPGISMTLSRDRAEAELAFDALGIGRIASQTIRFTRGAAEAGLVVSAYGRLVRR